MYTRRGIGVAALVLGLLAACESESPTEPPDGIEEPAAPSSFNATAASPTSIAVAWSAVAGATGYTLERRAGEGAFSQIATPPATATQHVDNALTPATAYTYRIRAVNGAGSSASKEATASTPSDNVVPVDPGSFTATAVSPSTIVLAWSAVAGASGYALERKTGDGGFGSLATRGSGETNYEDAGLTANTGYTYRIKALAGSASSAGREASATTLAAPTDPSKPEAFYAKGRVVTAAGEALGGVEIVIDNTVFHNSAVSGSTDAAGVYRLRVHNGSWRAYAKLERVYNGRTYTFDLDPDNKASFAGADGAVRNFVWKLSGPAPGYLGRAYYGGTIEVFVDANAELYDVENIQLTLTPVGPLVDGSAGEVITAYLGRPQTPEFGKLVDVAIGRYAITARYAPEDTEPRPLNVRIEGIGAYVPSLTADFDPIKNTCSNCLRLELNYP